jgi:hypothetical protein
MSVAMHLGFIPVNTKVFCYIILIGIKKSIDHNFIERLAKEDQKE